MTLSRRKFTKLALLSGASSATSSGIFFPKPAESFNLDFLIKDATSRQMFAGLIVYAGVKLIDTAFPPKPTTEKVITVAQNTLTENGFTEQRTEYGEIRDQSIIWGDEKQEFDPDISSNIPNPGFAIANNLDYYVPPSIFTASTVVGINTASKVLKEQHGLYPTEVGELLLPTHEISEDIGTWQGDNDPSIGNNPKAGFTIYRAKGAEVTRRYDRISEKLGKIQMYIDSPNYRGTITTNVRFSV
ncbi:MAG: twin-arginine translocation pathway signal protein [Crocosphaera sp.]|nr:twin-arginine translocation pathway signal protein [Crocosphaera sp.]